MSEEVRKLALTSSFPPFDYKFVPSGYFECSLDPTIKIEFGEVEYGSPNYTMHGGVRLKEWLFSLEESNFQPGFFLCAFVGKEHFTFGCLDANELRDAQSKFISTCMLELCQKLYSAEILVVHESTKEEMFTWKKVVTVNKE